MGDEKPVAVFFRKYFVHFESLKTNDVDGFSVGFLLEDNNHSMLEHDVLLADVV